MPNELQKLLALFPDKPWDWYRLSGNPNITMRDVLAHPDKPWNWSQISSNPFGHCPNLQRKTIKKLQITRARIQSKIKDKSRRLFLAHTELCYDLVDLLLGSSCAS